MAKHYYGIYRGTVTDNADPLGKLRIRALVPDILGKQPSSWALPCLPAGPVSAPEKKALVWVAFEGGDPDYPIWLGMIEADMGDTSFRR